MNTLIITEKKKQTSKIAQDNKHSYYFSILNR